MRFDTCENCVATPFCGLYNGKTETEKKSSCDSYTFLYASLALSEIPKRYYNANIHNYSKVSEEVNKLADRISKGVVKFVESSNMNVVITSEQTGNGKTYFGCLILNHYIYKTCLTEAFDLENPNALFVYYPDFIDHLRYNKDDYETNKRFELIKNIPLLMLDDVGAGKMSEFAREQTNILIGYRYNKELPTIVTSNYSSKALSSGDLLGARAISRLTDNAFVLDFNNSSFRKTIGGGLNG